MDDDGQWAHSSVFGELLGRRRPSSTESRLCDVETEMIVVSEIRCSDCLQEFHGSPRFAVIKEDKTHTYSDEERQLGGHLYQVLVCDDCAKWYGDDAVNVDE